MLSGIEIFNFFVSDYLNRSSTTTTTSGNTSGDDKKGGGAMEWIKNKLKALSQ